MAKEAPITTFSGPGNCPVEVITDDWACCVDDDGYAFLVGVEASIDEDRNAITATECNSWFDDLGWFH